MIMENNVKLELNINQVNVVLAALGKLPLEPVIDTFTVIRQQADHQLQNRQTQTFQSPSVKVLDD